MVSTVILQLLITGQTDVDEGSCKASPSHRSSATRPSGFGRLKAEHAFGGGYTLVKDYVRQVRPRHKKVFVPLAHPPGDAQADFGEEAVVIGGVEQKAYFLYLDLPYSDECFVMAFRAENTEALLEGRNQAFAYWGGVPRTILYDNTRIAVKEITGDGERQPTTAFSGLQSHYLFATKFGRPGT